jgi:hypothetical protein
LVVAWIKRLGWDEAALRQKRKGDRAKVALANELGAGTTLPPAWIAGRLAMGQSAINRLRRGDRLRGGPFAQSQKAL